MGGVGELVCKIRGIKNFNILKHFIFTTRKKKKHSKTKINIPKTKLKPNLSNLRPKWVKENHLLLYNNYFLIFSFNTFHSFSYLSDYLAPIFYNSIYESNYYSYYSD